MPTGFYLTYGWLVIRRNSLDLIRLDAMLSPTFRPNCFTSKRAVILDDGAGSGIIL